jgi:glycosyltransferase involved in cell wall biosynthesis
MSRLLILTNNSARASFRQRIDAYLPSMRNMGIEATVETLPRGLLARQRLFAQAGQFDGVLVHKKGLNILDAHLLRKNARRIIYNYDDAVMYSDRQPEKDSRSHSVPWRRMVDMSDMVIVGSEYLAGLGKKHNPRVYVVPIGLEVADYASAVPRPEDGRIRLVWIGSTDTLDYLKALKPVLEAIGTRRKDVVLRQICETFLDMDSMPVEKLKWEKEKRGEYLGTADIGLAPLPRDRFTMGKCSFKVLEYGAAGLPVVASPVGTNAEHIIDGVTGLLAGSQGQWEEYLTRLIEDAGLRKKMGQAGRLRAAEYDVNVIAPRFISLIKKAIE